MGSVLKKIDPFYKEQELKIKFFLKNPKHIHPFSKARTIILKNCIFLGFV